MQSAEDGLCLLGLVNSPRWFYSIAITDTIIIISLHNKSQGCTYGQSIGRERKQEAKQYGGRGLCGCEIREQSRNHQVGGSGLCLEYTSEGLRAHPRDSSVLSLIRLQACVEITRLAGVSGRKRLCFSMRCHALGNQVVQLDS